MRLHADRPMFLSACESGDLLLKRLLSKTTRLPRASGRNFTSSKHSDPFFRRLSLCRTPKCPFEQGSGQGAYSIAFGGDSLRECFAKFRYILERYPMIDTLVVSAEPHMFGTLRLDSSNRSFADYYFLSSADSAGLKRGWLSALLDQVPLLNDDFVQYFRAVLGRKMTTSVAAASEPPAAARSALWSQLPDTEQERKARADGLMDHKGVGDFEAPFVWYSRLIDLAHAHHIQVIGVRFPVHSAYAEQLSPEFLADLDASLQRIGIDEIVDLRYLFTNSDCFEDADHVKSQCADHLIQALERHTGKKFTR